MTEQAGAVEHDPPDFEDEEARERGRAFVRNLEERVGHLVDQGPKFKEAEITGYVTVKPPRDMEMWFVPEVAHAASLARDQYRNKNEGTEQEIRVQEISDLEPIRVDHLVVRIPYPTSRQRLEGEAYEKWRPVESGNYRFGAGAETRRTMPLLGLGNSYSPLYLFPKEPEPPRPHDYYEVHL